MGLVDAHSWPAGQRSERASSAGATWKHVAAELLAAYPTRDRFPVQSAGHLGPAPGLEGWRLAGQRRERRDLQHLQCHDALQAAYGAEIVHHRGPRILRDGMVLDCFQVERKSRLLKAYALHLRSGPGFERGIFARSFPASAHIAVAAREDVLRGEFCAKTMRTVSCLISYIGNKTSARQILVSLVCGLRVDERMAAVVAPLELLSKSATFSTWRQRRDSPVKVHCLQDGLRLALGWQRRGDIVKIMTG